jgi:PASTA domain
MTSPWTISAGTERVQLNPQRQGETTFTVTNSGPVDARAVVDVLPSENADRAWFTVDEPQRLVTHGGSATFPVRIAVRPDAPPGAYWLAARVYPADGAPEEASVTSGRVAFDLLPVSAVKRSNPLLWLIPVAVLVLAVGSVGGWLALRDTGSGEALPTTTATTAPPTTTTPAPPAPMPDLSGMPEQRATDLLKELGALVGTIRHQQDPANAGRVLAQSAPVGQPVPLDTPVDLVVAVSLGPAALSAPSNGTTFPKDGALPTLAWQPVPGAAAYRVQLESEVCGFVIVAITPCIYSDSFGGFYADYHARSFVDVTTPSATPSIELKVHPGVPRAGHSGNVRWQVIPLDDFGNPGPPSGFFQFHKTLRFPDEFGPIPG